MAEEDHVANLLRVLEIIDAALHIECYEFPVYKCFIVIESGIHAQNHQCSLRQLRAAGMLQVIGCAMNDDYGHLGRRVGIRSIEDALHAAAQRNVFRPSLRKAHCSGESKPNSDKQTDQRRYRSFHAPNPPMVFVCMGVMPLMNIYYLAQRILPIIAYNCPILSSNASH